MHVLRDLSKGARPVSCAAVKELLKVLNLNRTNSQVDFFTRAIDRRQCVYHKEVYVLRCRDLYSNFFYMKPFDKSLLSVRHKCEL